MEAWSRQRVFSGSSINGSEKTETGLDNMERQRGGGGTAANEKRKETVQIKETDVNSTD